MSSRITVSATNPALRGHFFLRVLSEVGKPRSKDVFEFASRLSNKVEPIEAEHKPLTGNRKQTGDKRTSYTEVA